MDSRSAVAHENSGHSYIVDLASNQEKLEEFISSFIAEHFESFDCCFLHGSALRGDAKPRSDIDLFITVADPSTSYREKKLWRGVLFDIYVYNSSIFVALLNRAPKVGNFALVATIADAKLLADPSGEGKGVQALATKLRQIRPALPPAEPTRQYLTGLIDDLIDCVDATSVTMISVELYRTIALGMVAQAGFAGYEKQDAARLLNQLDPSRFNQLDTALKEAITGNAQTLINQASDWLEHLGGELRHSYRAKIYTGMLEMTDKK